MKKINILISFLFIAVLATAQQDYKAGNEGWLVDLEKAYAQSKKTGKPIMANFTGSDWCGWCKRLTANVFSKPQFKDWAEENVVLLELDFPRRKEIPNEIRQQNYSLQQAFKVRGYPTVWVFHLDKNEKGQRRELATQTGCQGEGMTTGSFLPIRVFRLIRGSTSQIQSGFKPRITPTTI